MGAELRESDISEKRVFGLARMQSIMWAGCAVVHHVRANVNMIPHPMCNSSYVVILPQANITRERKWAETTASFFVAPCRSQYCRPAVFTCQTQQTYATLRDRTWDFVKRCLLKFELLCTQKDKKEEEIHTLLHLSMHELYPMSTNKLVAIPLNAHKALFTDISTLSILVSLNKHAGGNSSGIEIHGENSTPQNYCEAAKRVAIPAKFLPSFSRFCELKTYIRCCP